MDSGTPVYHISNEAGLSTKDTCAPDVTLQKLVKKLLKVAEVQITLLQIEHWMDLPRGVNSSHASMSKSFSQENEDEYRRDLLPVVISSDTPEKCAPLTDVQEGQLTRFVQKVGKNADNKWPPQKFCGKRGRKGGLM